MAGFRLRQTPGRASVRFDGLKFGDACALEQHERSRSLGCDAQARLSGGDADRLASHAETPFDLAFLDPPYDQGLDEAALARLAAGGWLAEDALAVVERGADEPALAVAGYKVLDTRRWGAARVWFLSRV